MNDPNNVEEIMLELKSSYPNVEFSSYHHSIFAKVSLNEASDYVRFELTKQPNLSTTSVYEENWLKSKKWICYNKSYSQDLGSGSRFGGEDPIKVFDEAIDGLHYGLNRIIELARLSEIFLQKTNKAS